MLKQKEIFHHDLSVKQDFPLLKQSKLVFLDSAASAQKPQQVINAISKFYENDYANIHRGIYELSARATKRYEACRYKVKEFINAKSVDEVVFVRGTTEAINLLAQSYGLQAGDEVILSEMEHHANIVPWYQLGVKLKVVRVLDDGKLDLAHYQSLFSERTKLVALTHVSNAIGTINPVKEITTIAHQHNVPILIDGAQAAAHFAVDVQDIDCDFYTFSSHKIYGPTGIGVLYAKEKYLKQMPPYQGGGDMIETVSFDKVTYAKGPQKFEAGTPHIAGAIGMHAAIDYMQSIGMTEIYHHDQALLNYAEMELQKIDGLKIIGNSHPKVGVISFVIDGIHPHDLGTVLDHEGIAIRAGHHCAMPLMERFNVPATVRVSFGVYNNKEDVDALIAGLQTAKRLFA